MSSSSAPIFRGNDDLVAHLERVGAGRVVVADGCFDPLHVGHVRYLEGAAAQGDFLIVALNDDDSTRDLKGNGRPIVAEMDRARIIAGLRCVDAVLVFGAPDVAGILEEVRPRVHAKGTDYTVETVPEREVAGRLGIEIAIVGDPKTHASSEVLKQMRETGRKNNQ